uniref:Small ribosomal subunit protein uS7m n=1 Tax=Xenopus tropicalis TaxID=8364 RepID=A0A6I8RW40_XENTR
MRFLPGKVVLLTQVRWTRYSPQYLDPEPDKEVYKRPLEELSEQERADRELKIVRPIKAAPSNVTSSVFSDLTVRYRDINNNLTLSCSHRKLQQIKRTQLEKYYKAPEEERASIECNPYTIFHQALHNCQPIIGLTSVLRGGKSYQVPTPLKENRRRFLAMKWLITECREHKHRRTLMYEKLSQAILDAYEGQGEVVKKKHELHKMAEANRAFAHFRWW